MIRQTVAIFVDAYRELNAKKMFWIVMILSLVCVAALASIGIYERTDAAGRVTDSGITLLTWEFKLQLFDVFRPSRKLFYNLLFFTVGFKVWLAWAATVLALVSTAGIIPDFISGGAIDLMLSKPIGRLRLFLTKYLAGLLFVVLQVTVFAAAAFVVIGLRAKVWEPVLFLSIPVVVAFFSYLFSIQVLIGMVTRSAIASLLLTACVWLCIFALHVAEAGPLLEARIRQDQAVAIRENDLAKLDERIAAKRAGVESDKEDPSGRTLDELEKERGDKDAKLAEFRSDQSRLAFAHSIVFAVKTVLPKTSETIQLLQRALVSRMEIASLVENAPEPPRRRFARDPLQPSETSVRKEYERVLAERSVGWVLGTSLVFQVVVLGIAGWIFVRRDF